MFTKLDLNQGYTRELTQKNTHWEWTDRHDNALHQLKKALANAPVTSYFDPKRETKINVDASPVGLGAILAQMDPSNGAKHVVADASRFLSKVEQRYSQTEREALAVVWGVQILPFVYLWETCNRPNRSQAVSCYLWESTVKATSTI